MPQLDNQLLKEVNSALGLTRAAEIVRATSPYGSAARRHWANHRLEALYELAFLRVFVAWETFLEESFWRYLCGYASARFGAAIPKSHFCANLQSAERLVLGGKPFRLWYDPSTVVTRSKTHLVNGRHEIVVSSAVGRLEDFSRIRHRIVHGQRDAKARFDSATMTLAGRRYAASRPGRFLRDYQSGTKTRWLEAIVIELGSLAGLIV